MSGPSGKPQEGTLRPAMHRAATPPGPGLGAGDLAALSAASGLRLQAFRAEHVADRIDRALAAERRTTADELAVVLRLDARARDRFRRSVAVSHSGFFRDPEQFDALELRILPRLLEHSMRLRAWSAGCATGLELWSLGVLLSRVGALDSAQLLGSDLLEENIAVARAGSYEVVEITPALRRRARWEQRDLVHDPPPCGRFDLIMCRNVAIYLEPAAKTRLHAMLAAALAPGGVVMLGRSERLGDPATLGLRRLEPHVYERPR
jgi:chemotaxis protein methyltransferase CheR